MSILLAIDPGLSGGIAWQIGSGKACAVKMPETESDIAEIIDAPEIHAALVNGTSVVAFIENVPIAMPGKGAAMAKLNANAGFIRGLLCGLGIRTILVRPVKWQEHYEFGSKPKKRNAKGEMVPDDTTWKNKLKAEAQRRFPGLKVTLDTADALLILDYAKAQPTH